MLTVNGLKKRSAITSVRRKSSFEHKKKHPGTWVPGCLSYSMILVKILVMGISRFSAGLAALPTASASTGQKPSCSLRSYSTSKLLLTAWMLPR